MGLGFGGVLPGVAGVGVWVGVGLGMCTGGVYIVTCHAVACEHLWAEMGWCCLVGLGWVFRCWVGIRDVCRSGTYCDMPTAVG